MFEVNLRWSKSLRLLERIALLLYVYINEVFNQKFKKKTFIF